jgi:lauroyl/myristoyl acyltransferase
MSTNSFTKYFKEAKSCVTKLLANGDEQTVRQSAIVGASLSNFYAGLPNSDHAEIFKGILVNQRLSFYEQSFVDALNQTKVIGLDANDILRLKQHPRIICTFHFGSYRLINHLLANQGIPFSLVISRYVSQQQSEMFRVLFDQFKCNSSSGGFEIIDAEDNSSGLKILRSLKQGKSLVIYIDGNTGSGDLTINNENTLKIRFLDQNIKARKGVAALSYISKTPILPVVCVRSNDNKNTLIFGKKINPQSDILKDDYIQSTTQEIFDFLGLYIKKYPSQWEAWLYLHKFAILEIQEELFSLNSDTLNQQALKFNKNLFALFKINSKNVLLKKNNYMAYVISSHLNSILEKAQFRAIEINEFDQNIINELMMKRVLISENS